MNTIVRVPVVNPETQEVKFETGTINNVKVHEESIMSIDGSTTCSGVCILNKQGLILYSMAFIRDKKTNETPVQYKVRFKKQLTDIFINNPDIKQVYYEEPFWGYAESAKILMMLRTSVEEIIEENSPALNYLKLTEVSNKKWKKIFLAPDPCPSNSELEKEAVRKKLVNMLPLMAEVTQDEMDAASMGYVALWKLESHRDNELESRKKQKPFKYNIKFIGADNESDMLDEFGFSYRNWNIPEKLIDTIEMYDLPGKGNFDDYVYKGIGDEDILLILGFKSKHYGNIILQHRIGGLAKQFDKIYAICWRKTRR